MAKKSSGGAKESASTPKAGKKAAVKKTAVKSATKSKAETASKSGTPKAAAAKAAAPKAAAKTSTKKASPKKAPLKLNDRQADILKKIHGAGDAGYPADKGEDRTIEALNSRKLVKRGKKNADTGKFHHHITKTGAKHVGSSGPSGPGNGI